LSRFRRPQQTLFPGLGVAGTVVAAVIATSALASGIVAYSLSSKDPLARPSAALVLDPVRPDTIAETPPVRRGAREPATSRRSRRAAVVAAGADRQGAVGSLPFPQGVAPGSDPGPQHGGDGVAGPERTAQPVPDRAPEPVHRRTGSLAGGLRATAGVLGTDTEAIASTVVVALDDTGDALRNVAGGAGTAVARLLVRPPAG